MKAVFCSTRRWFQLLFVLCLGANLLLCSPVYANAPLSKLDQEAIDGGWVNWKPSADSNVCLGGAAGAGPLSGPRFPKVDDTAVLAQKLKDYMTNTLPSSPLIAYANNFVSLGQKYNVNPAMAVLQAQKETSLATTGNGPPPKYNFYNERSSSTPGGWRIFSGYPDAIDHYYQLINGDLYLGSPSNFTTVDQIINRFAPPSDGNDTAGYIQFVKSGMAKILGGVVNVSAADVSTTASSCGSGVTAEGAYGWNINGAHAMINYDQIDPRWADHPYGAGKESIGTSGCGPTSLAMIAATLLHDGSITPISLADRYGATYHKSDGTSWSLFPVFANDYSLKIQDLGTDLNAATNTIKAGGLVLISVDSGYFTSQGHFMVVRAVTSDGSGYYLADPNGAGIHKDSEIRAFTSDFLLGQGNLKHLWGFTR